MPKNILIFSDGTGQIGGLKPDQRLSNVYKLYRATRPGPDSPISYFDQVAFYDPGLGTGELSGVTFHKVRSLLESAVGAGIDTNIIDCYEKILSCYQEGDRIFLFGFSRGAYTVRALANVMNLCGVPTRLPDGTALPKSGDRLRGIATEAVKSVYGHGAGKPRGDQPYLDQREEKGRRFRARYGSRPGGDQPDVQGNVQPDFIGVFDTVAALQSAGVTWTVRIAFGAALALFALSFHLEWPAWLRAILGLPLLASFVVYLKIVWSQIRFFEPDPEKPLNRYLPWHWPRFWSNSHRAYWRKQHYDKWLDSDVGFARHAMSIDEHRADFPRVEWGSQSQVAKNAHKTDPRWLDQVWFAGCHSDIGGSYLEGESRLSDITLDWMVAELRACFPTVIIREELLHRTPDPLGLQHEETYFNRWLGIRWRRKPRPIEQEFKLHPSVIARLEAASVPHHDSMRPYRPEQLRSHPDARRFFD